MKSCRLCQGSKPLDDYYRNRTSPDGRQGRCKACCRAVQAESYRSGHGRRISRESQRRRRYGIEPEVYDAMVEEQDGVCAICSRPATGTGPDAVLHVDHDHQTGAVRGLLCPPCNKALGFFADDPDRIRAALAYLTPENAHAHS